MNRSTWRDDFNSTSLRLLFFLLHLLILVEIWSCLMLGLITASHAQLLSGMKEKQNGQDFLNLICIYKNLSMKIAVAHDSLLGQYSLQYKRHARACCFSCVKGTESRALLLLGFENFFQLLIAIISLLPFIWKQTVWFRKW